MPLRHLLPICVPAASGPGRLAPYAVIVRAARNFSARDARILADPVLSLTLEPHPELLRLLRESNARRTSTGWSVPAGQMSWAGRLRPGAWRAERGAQLPAGLAEERPGRSRGAGRFVLHAAPGPRTWSVRPQAQLRVAGVEFTVTAGTVRSAPVLLDPLQAAEVVAACRAGGVPVLHRLPQRMLQELSDLVEVGCVFRSVPGLPAFAAGQLGNDLAATVGPVAATQIAAVKLPGGHSTVAMTTLVAEAAAAGHARRAGRVGLRPWQDQFVSAYLASRRGLVNALPAGAGKTVCAAAALAQRHADRAGTTEPPTRSLVVAAPGLAEQWTSELAVFFPQARVLHATGSVELAAAMASVETDAAAPGRQPVVLIVSAELATRCTATLSVPWDDLVVDEAAFLRSPAAARSRAVWTIRDGCAAAMPLTGTPDGVGIDDLGQLVAFARGDRGLFTDLPLSAAHEIAALDRVGPLVFTADVSSALPSTRPEVVELPAPPDLALQDAARRERLRELLASATPSAVAVRAALTDARRASVAGAGGSGKVEWVARQVAAAVAEGQRLLVFADTTAALESLSQILTGSGVPAALFTGKVSAARRRKVVEAFQVGTVPVLLISVAGQLGLNLQAADTVVHLDVPETAAAFAQRTARAARMASTHPRVRVLVPVLAGTLEDDIAQVVTGADVRVGSARVGGPVGLARACVETGNRSGRVSARAS